MTYNQFTLADDADVTERLMLNRTSMVPNAAGLFVIVLAVYMMFVLGFMPSAEEHEISFVFLNSTISIGSMTLFARFM